jgi:hypothetical protein
VSTAEWAGNPSGTPVAAAGQDGNAANGELLAALAGRQAARERAVAENTRRVVMTSLGVMQDQKAGRKRSRSLVLASLLLVLIALVPFIWRVTDDLIGGELLSDMATQLSLWACILCPAVLAAVLVAGWSRGRS